MVSLTKRYTGQRGLFGKLQNDILLRVNFSTLTMEFVTIPLQSAQGELHSPDRKLVTYPNLKRKDHYRMGGCVPISAMLLPAGDFGLATNLERHEDGSESI